MANEKINILAVEASSVTPSVALYAGGEIVQLSASAERTQADHLLELVEQLLKQTGVSLKELTGLACGRGPGSFTGLRIAAAVVQGLAYTAKKPVAMISSLAALAASVPSLSKSAPNEGKRSILACIDARKQQVYYGLYGFTESGELVTRSEEHVCDPEQVTTDGVSAIGVGNGFAQYPRLSEGVDQVFSQQGPEARWVASLAAKGYANFAPAYMATPVYVRDNVTHTKA